MTNAGLILLTGGEAAVVAPQRGGLVTAEHKAVRDDGGLWHPLGITNFCAFHHAEFHPDTYGRNLDLLGENGFDFQRALGIIDFTAAPVDSSRANYEQIVAYAMDEAWKRKVRTEVTVVGGWHGRDYNETARKIAAVVANRPHALMFADGFNEWDVNQQVPTLEDVMAFGRLLKTLMPKHLTALGSFEPDGSSEPLRRATVQTGMPFLVDHHQRDGGNLGWNNVSVFDGPYYPVANNDQEPSGPGSSVTSTTQPIQLAMARATSALGGWSAYTFHLSDGIDGTDRFDARSGRQFHAYFGNVPEWAAWMAALHAVGPLLPPGVQNWTKCGGQAWLRTTGDFRSGQIASSFAAVEPGTGRYCMTVNGVRGQVQLRAPLAMQLEAVDPVNGTRVAGTVQAQGMVNLAGRDDTMAGYIINGQILDMPAAPFAGIGTLDEWHAYIDQLWAARVGGSVLTAQGLDAIEPFTVLFGGWMQHNRAGEQRGRIFLPTGDPGDLFSRTVDLGTLNGSRAWVPR